MMRRIVGALVSGALATTGLLGATTVAADAHSIALSGVKTCLPDGSWKVLVKVDVTNTPSSGDDSRSEVKAMKPTGSPGVSADGGVVVPGSPPKVSVMSGGQVILNAWAEHAVNWTNVKTRRGNYVDYYTIYVPASVASTETEVQIDWKGWGSADPRKTFGKPEGCVATPRDATATVAVTPPTCERAGSASYTTTHAHLIGTFRAGPGSHVAAFESDAGHQFSDGSTTKEVSYDVAPRKVTQDCFPQPSADRQTRDVVGAPDCATLTVTTQHQARTRSYVWDGSSYVPGPWGEWVTTSTDTRAATAQECPPTVRPEPPAPPVPPTPPAPPTPPTSKHVRTHVKVVDRCNCFHDSVKMRGDRHKVKIYGHRVNKTTWRFVVVGKVFRGHQYLLPSRVGGNRGWSESQVYTVRTTSKPCPCRKDGTCHQQPRPKDPCPVGRGGLVCK